jgi:dTDP-4-dehydrorhamnose reductase
VIFNAAAYTDVEAAEREVERAEVVNCRGAGNLAEAADLVGARLIHLSTDFVFDGTQGHPYTPEDDPHPLGVYGRTKLGGEREVLRVTGGAALIVRTSWVYSARGRNFALSMLRRMGGDDPVGVVADQVGTPTWAASLADALWRMAALPELRGVHHWTDAGVASWYDFAVAIQEEGLALGLLGRRVELRPLRTSEYPTNAPRPPYSVLDKTATWRALGGAPPHWRAQLRRMLQGLAGE